MVLPILTQIKLKLQQQQGMTGSEDVSFHSKATRRNESDRAEGISEKGTLDHTMNDQVSLILYASYCTTTFCL